MPKFEGRMPELKPISDSKLWKNAYWWARRCPSPAVEAEDFYLVSLVAQHKASLTYNPDLGASYTTHSWRLVREACIDAARRLFGRNLDKNFCLHLLDEERQDDDGKSLDSLLIPTCDCWEAVDAQLTATFACKELRHVQYMNGLIEGETYIGLSRHHGRASRTVKETVDRIRSRMV